MKLAPGLCAAATASLLFGVGSASASPLEIPIDTASTTGLVPLVYGSHTLNAAISSVVETDSYTFNATAGDVVRLNVATSTGSLDASVVLRGPGGDVVATTGCATGFSGCTVALEQALSASGTYTINVFDVGQDESGAYQMHIEAVPPQSQNMLGIPYATELNYTIDHTTDIDFFAFYANPGTGVRVALTSTSGSLDSSLEVWDPAGTKVANACATGFAGCATFLDLTIPDTSPAGAFYRIGVSDVGLDEAGDYSLQISCLFGACPTAIDPTPPFPVPEPATWWLFGGGLAALALRRRLGRRERCEVGWSRGG